MQYSPSGDSIPSRNSRVFVGSIKNDSTIHLTKDGVVESVRGIDYLVTALASRIDEFPFLKRILNTSVVLVPMPRSAPLKVAGALWPTRRICQALVSAGLGSEISPLLKRKYAVQKSATAPPGMRPGPEQHYDSTEIDNDAPALIEKPITLVDDVVTRGASFVGMFTRLVEAFPNREISCFALVQTVSEGEIDKIIFPSRGTITRYPSGKLWRGPDPGEQQTLSI